jgi:hypothetical protein
LFVASKSDAAVVTSEITRVPAAVLSATALVEASDVTFKLS